MIVVRKDVDLKTTLNLIIIYILNLLIIILLNKLNFY